MSRASIPPEDKKQVASVSVEGWQKRWLDNNKGKYNFSLRAREMLTRDIEEIEGFKNNTKYNDSFGRMKETIKRNEVKIVRNEDKKSTKIPK